MSKKNFLEKLLHKYLFALGSLILFDINSDVSSSSNHGYTGLINTPTAIFRDAGTISTSLYRGDPDRKLSLTLAPFDWVEGGFFYADITGKEYGGGYLQSYKDKGFNIKFRLKTQGKYPAIAIGLNDFAGTGLYSSEYIVSTYSQNKFDFSLGMGWGALNSNGTFKNPLSAISDRFNNRSLEDCRTCGNLDFDNYFSGDEISLFGGVKYKQNKNLVFKMEYDTTNTNQLIDYDKPNTRFNIGLDYIWDKNLALSFTYERGNYFGASFKYAENISKIKSRQPSYEKVDTSSKLIDLSVNLQKNEISVTEVNIAEKGKLQLGLQQIRYQDQRSVSSVVHYLIEKSNIKNAEEVIIKNYNDGILINTVASKKQKDNSIRDVNVKNIDIEEAIWINDINYPKYLQKFIPRFRTFIASREGFLNYGLFLEHLSRTYFSAGLSITSQISISLTDNFGELNIPPVDTYPAQVRSDIKKYMNGLGEGLSIQKLFVSKFGKAGKNNYFYLTSGILEDMFNGFGGEFLHHDFTKRVSYGFELFRVKKRDYKFGFGMQDYMKTTGHINLYKPLTNGLIMKLSWGQYLAGDEGGTLRVWKRFRNGAEMGAHVSFTDVSFEEFGEGSFDKGIFFKFPVNLFGQGSIQSFNWKPLTKDPASKLYKPHDLYSEIIRYH